MFGLKFKRKTDSVSSSSGTSNTNYSKTETDSSSSSSFPTRPSTDLSPTQQDPKQIIPTAFSSSSTNLVGRSNSNGSTNDYSYNNNNSSSPFPGYHSTSSTAPTSPVQSQYPDKAEIYQVPLDHVYYPNTNTATIKVPMPDDCCTTTTSSAYTTAPSSFNSEIYRRSSQQGPRTNAATKPAVGTFASTTDGPAHSSSTFAAHSSNHGMDHGTSGSVPASATSSATPSRSSSTSNRGGGGGAGVSTGSFTPLSATPPMTPRLAHDIADSLGANLGDQQQLLARALTPQQQGHQPYSQQQMMTGAGSPSSQQQAFPSIYGSLLDESDSQATAAAGGVGFVSSPISFQPPLNNVLSGYGHGQTQSLHATFPQDSFQNVYMPAFPEDNKPTSPTKGQFAQNHQQQGTGFSTRDALMQQQQYQQQQMAQFREDTQGGGCNNNNNNNNNNKIDGPLTSAGAVAAALAKASAPSATTLTNSRERTVSMAESTISNGQHSTATSPTTAGHFPTHRAGGSAMESDSQQQQHQQQGSIAHTVGGGSTFFPAPITRASTTLAASHLITHDVRQSSEHSHIEDGAGPVMLMAIGKTGQGKSSLLNKIMGTSELKASASVRAVTKGIAERTGWGRFEDSRRVLVTLADTPGLADTEGDDEKNIPILKEYIKSVGTRLGVTAFLLVFKIDSGVDMIITILQTFNDIMKDFPNFWDNVILVFTGCDYRRNVMNTKQLYHEEIQAQLQQHFFRPESGPSSTPATTTGTTDASLDPIVPMVFLTCAEAPCGFALGEKCDCKARTTFLNAGIKRLWYAVRNKKRWVLDQDQDDDLQGHA